MTDSPPFLADPDRRSPLSFTRASVEAQGELFPLKAVVEIPNGETAEAWGVVVADDTHRYVVKGNKGGETAKASEWVSTKIAEQLNIPCPTPKIVQMISGELFFGSREISGVSDITVTSEILTSTTAGEKSNKIPGLASFLSSLYAFDQFVNNVDRHDENYISTNDRGTRRFYAIDFGKSIFSSLPMSQYLSSAHHTVRTGRLIRQRHGFDQAAATAMIDRLSAFPADQISTFLSGMPSEWLDEKRRREFLAWWTSDAFRKRIEKVRKGLIDGSLL